MNASSSYPVEAIPGGVRLRLLVQPRAAISEAAGLHDGRIKIRLAAPPVDGAANAALLTFLAKTLKVSRAAVVIHSGTTGRRKMVEVVGVSVDQARHLLLPARQ